MKKIGIVYSPGFGAGWSSWGDDNSALDQEMARAIEAGEPLPEILRIANKNWPNQYTGGLENVRVQWVDEGTQFLIDEYDGSESVVLRDDGEIWRTAKESNQ